MSASIVGLAGRKRSGKDTAARALIEAGYAPDSFAKDLKDIAYAIRGVHVRIPIGVNVPGMRRGRYATYQDTVDALDLDVAKEVVPDVRLILQTLGSEGIRGSLGDTIWVDRAISRAIQRQQNGINTVLTDVRFPNEADAIRNAGGIVIRIRRPGVQPSDTHQSEQHIDELTADHTIQNDGSISDLHRRVLAAIKEH